MSGRKRRGYKKVFEAVRQLLPDDINLKRAVTDFEGGLWRPTLEIFSINDDSTSPCRQARSQPYASTHVRTHCKGE